MSDSISGEIRPNIRYAMEKSVTFSLTARDLDRAAAVLAHGSGGKPIIGEKCGCGN
ncbi:hypothetical protein [Microbulbifer discodermiae]|uniref:hypothetical protein n=1 Tax=Microbulbifer sp. 2201CG32-9 TaxID=3232309 RepID=UPI00345BB99B